MKLWWASESSMYQPWNKTRRQKQKSRNNIVVNVIKTYILPLQVKQTQCSFYSGYSQVYYLTHSSIEKSQFGRASDQELYKLWHYITHNTLQDSDAYKYLVNNTLLNKLYLLAPHVLCYKKINAVHDICTKLSKNIVQEPMLNMILADHTLIYMQEINTWFQQWHKIVRFYSCKRKKLKGELVKLSTWMSKY